MSGFPAFQGDRAHDGVVGAEGGRRDVQLQIAAAHLLFQAVAQALVGGDSAAHAQHAVTGLVQGLQRFAHQTVDDRLLKTGGQIGDLWLSQLDLAQIEAAGARDGVADGGLQAAEAELQPLSVL